MEEQKLLEKIRANDPSFIKELFDTYKTMVFNVCFRMLGKKEEAEDLMQDVFFTAYKSNACLNLQRKRKLEKWLSLDFLLESKREQIPHSQNDTPLEALEKSERENIVRNAINSLPDNQRISIILSRYENLSYQEISKIMECSVSSVESYLFRAKQNLAKKLISIFENSLL
ncbi:RNA polymerase sigma factor [Candidatus Desantisbacteria bacterium]|nr:RNA polymerase sigma factor [Candidatus Desantisbacteria bacterium]